MLRYALRAALLPIVIASFLGGGRIPGDDPSLVRTVVRTARWARRACRLLGVHVRRPAVRRRRGGSFTVLNHVSWIDALLLAACRPSVFVTSTETGEHPLLGRICATAGCVFMERRRRGSLGAERDRLARLMARLPLLVFPEATSSNGDAVLPFKPAAFASAIAAGADVQLLALHYPRIDGRPLGRRNRDRIHWYGDMAFLPHLLGFLAIGRVEAELEDLGELASATADRKQLASRAHGIIAGAVDRRSPLPRAA